MKLLLDENLPKRLKEDFLNHEVFTVRELGRNGVKNGELLKLMIENGFNALITFDKNLQHQQNFQKYTLTVFVLVAGINQYEVLTRLSSKVLAHLAEEVLRIGPIIITA